MTTPPARTTYNSRAVRLAHKMQADLRRGRFKPGERLPAEQELAGIYGVSRSTVRRTLERLVTDEQLVKTPWRGVRVPGGAAAAGAAAGRQAAWITVSMSGEAEEYGRGLQEVLAAAGFTLGIYCSQADPGRFGQLLEHLMAMQPAGIVLQHCDIYQQPGNLEGLAKIIGVSGIPVVRLDSEDRLPFASDQVHGSPHYVGRIAARYLAAKNYRDLTFLSECPEEECRDVVTGLRFGLAPAGISLPDERVIHFETPHGYGPAADPFIDAEQTMRRLLAAGFRRGTLIAGHDYPATGILRAVLAAGLRVPEEVQVISLLRCQVTGAAPMRLTTVETHREEKGYMAGRQLLRRIAGEAGPPEVVSVVADELLPGETG
ncbi:MAG: GntR family transcriptional regulator [Lentisphaeria bacterium]